MKNKKVISLVIVCFIVIAVIIVFVLLKKDGTDSGQGSIADINEIVNEINYTNEEIENIIKDTTEKTNDIQKNDISKESESKIEQKITNEDVKKTDVNDVPNINENKQIEKQSTVEKNEEIQKEEKDTSNKNEVTSNSKADNKQIENEVVNEKEETKDNNEERLKCDHENNKNWFNTEKEAIAIYEAEVKKYGDLWENNEIDDETYYKKCPEGYETWSCPFCGKWSINMYY